MQEIIE